MRLKSPTLRVAHVEIAILPGRNCVAQYEMIKKKGKSRLCSAMPLTSPPSRGSLFFEFHYTIASSCTVLICELELEVSDTQTNLHAALVTRPDVGMVLEKVGSPLGKILLFHESSPWFFDIQPQLCCGVVSVPRGCREGLVLEVVPLHTCNFQLLKTRIVGIVRVMNFVEFSKNSRLIQSQACSAFAELKSIF